MSGLLVIVENYWKKEGEKDLEGIMECFHPDARFSAPITEDLQGSTELRKFYAGVVEGFANSNVTINRSTELGNRSGFWLQRFYSARWQNFRIAMLL